MTLTAGAAYDRRFMADSIGNCEVLEEIGSGGMATVFRAIQQPLGRTVAIKALKPSIAVDSQFAKRFEREAHFLASLQHENILHVHDFVKQDGSMFIIMEHVMGIDVFDLLERVPQLPIEVAGKLIGKTIRDPGRRSAWERRVRVVMTGALILPWGVAISGMGR